MEIMIKASLKALVVALLLSAVFSSAFDVYACSCAGAGPFLEVAHRCPGYAISVCGAVGISDDDGLVLRDMGYESNLKTVQKGPVAEFQRKNRATQRASARFTGKVVRWASLCAAFWVGPAFSSGATASRMDGRHPRRDEG
jgi:hypothetical protein